MPTYTFDPVEKRIMIPRGTVEVDMRDVYDQMMEWAASDDGMPSRLPIRARGHEDITTALYTDVIFVLQNGWKLKPEGGPGSPAWPQGIGHDPGYEFTGWRNPLYWQNVQGTIETDEINVRSTDDFGEAEFGLRFHAPAGGTFSGDLMFPGPMSFSFMTTMCFWVYIEDEEMEHLQNMFIRFSNDQTFTNYVEFYVGHNHLIPGWNHITMSMQDKYMTSFGTGTLASPIEAIQWAFTSDPGEGTWLSVDRVAYNHSAMPTATIGVRPFEGVSNEFFSIMAARGIPFYMPFVQNLADDGTDEFGNPGFALEAELHTLIQTGLCIPINAFTGDETAQTRDETRTAIKSNANWVVSNFSYAFPQASLAMRFAAIRSLGGHDHVTHDLVSRIRDFTDYAMSDASIGLNHLPFEDNYHVRAVVANKLTMPVAQLKDFIEYTQESGLYMNLLMHKVNDSGDPDAYTTAEYEEILDHFTTVGLILLDPFTLISKVGAYTLKILGSCFDEIGVAEPITVPPDSGTIEVVRVVATHGTIWEVGDVFQELVGKAEQIQEIFDLHGLNPEKPLVVSKTKRTAGVEIEQDITIDELNDETTVERQP